MSSRNQRLCASGNQGDTVLVRFDSLGTPIFMYWLAICVDERASEWKVMGPNSISGLGPEADDGHLIRLEKGLSHAGDVVDGNGVDQREQLIQRPVRLAV